jgi:hypothetical protein
MNVREKIENLRKGLSIPSEQERTAQNTVDRRRHAAKDLTNAVETLATGTGDVRARLLLASMSIMLTQREDFPEDKRALWENVMKTIERFEIYFQTGSGTFMNTPKKATWGMRNATAQRAARQVWELYWSVSKNQRYE